MGPSESEKFMRIQGWLTPVEADSLYDSALKVPDGGCIVEIGSFKGRSTYALALACLGRKVTVYAVDTFAGSPGDHTPEYETRVPNMFEEFKSNLRDMIDGGIVQPLRMSSGGALMCGLNPHLVFIDGSHTYEDVLFDLMYWWPRIRPGGALAAHDYSMKTNPSVVHAVNKWSEENHLTMHAQADSIAWFVKD